MAQSIVWAGMSVFIIVCVYNVSGDLLFEFHTDTWSTEVKYLKGRTPSSYCRCTKCNRAKKKKKISKNLGSKMLLGYCQYFKVSLCKTESMGFIHETPSRFIYFFCKFLVLNSLSEKGSYFKRHSQMCLIINKYELL